jgi:two-component system response regulator YesN
MLRVMIIDDEERIRLGLAKLVEQVDPQVKVCGVYASGKELLEQLDSVPVDLIITDIKMPQMNGLTLIEKVQLLRPQIRFAILSGFNDFSFAQQAIRLGVEEYLLKPVETAELTQMLDRVKEKLNLEETRQSVAAEDSFRLLLSQDTHRLPDPLRVLANTELGRHPLFQHYYVTMIIRAQSDQIAERVQRITAGWEREVKTVSWEVDQIVVLAGIGSGDYGDTARSLGMALLQAMPAHVKVRIGISSLFAGAETLRECYKQAYSSLEFAWYEPGIRTLVSYDQMPKVNEDNCASHRLIDRDFREHLRLLDLDKAMNTITAWLNELTTRRLPWQGLKDYALLVQNVVLNERLERNLSTPSSGEEPAEWLPGRYADWEDYAAALYAWVLQHVQALKDVNQENRVVETIKSFVHEHHTEELELTQLAEIVYLTPSYLSKMFRTKTGETITDYIISVRMEHAKRLLREEYALKTYEVGQRVGYADPAYFNKVFKRVVGLTPKEYRDRVRS